MIKMELKKVNENITRSYNEQGEGTDRVESASYNIVDEDGNVAGYSSIYAHGHAEVRLNEIYNFSSIEEGEDKIKDLFGI